MDIDVKTTLCLLFGMLLSLAVWADNAIVHQNMGQDYALARESVIEAIEGDGLVVGAIISFSKMLERTASVAGDRPSPLETGEVIQFCSARLAWAMVDEAPEQLVMCPLSVALYISRQAPGHVTLVYRPTDASTPARVAANQLLARIMDRARRYAGVQ